MYLIFLAFLTFGATIWVIWYQEQSERKKIDNEVARRDAARQQLIEIDNHFIDLMISDFMELGWAEWDESIHKADGQLDRIKRGVDPDSNITLLQYNPSFGIAKIRGTNFDFYLVSGHRCSCPDFRERQLPCKHMYFLAMILPDYKDYIKHENSILSENQCDDTLNGLRFSIVGRNQEIVKRFILEHGGTFGNERWRDTSAVVLASDQKTQRYYDACEKNIEIFSFDELKTLFTVDADCNSTIPENTQ